MKENETESCENSVNGLLWMQWGPVRMEIFEATYYLKKNTLCKTENTIKCWKYLIKISARKDVITPVRTTALRVT